MQEQPLVPPRPAADADACPFDRLLRDGHTALPFVHPLRVPESERTKRLELQALTVVLIEDFWKFFERARERSIEHPHLGYLFGLEPKFERPMETFQSEFRLYGLPRLIARIDKYMLESLSNCFDTWKSNLSRRGPQTDAVFPAYERAINLLSEGVARRATDLRGLILPGAHTALSSMLSSCAAFPIAFEKKFDRKPTQAEARMLIEEVFLLHTRFATTSFDLFVVFVDLLGLPTEPFPFEYSADDFEIIEQGHKLRLNLSEPKTRQLQHVIDIQKSLGRDDDGIETISGCPALYAKVSAERKTISVVSALQSWIRDNLELFLIPRFQA